MKQTKNTKAAKPFGIPINIQALVCRKCRHGEDGSYIPLTVTARCPKCNSQKGHMLYSEFLNSLVGQEFWYVADIWEEFCPILVTVASISATKRKMLRLCWELGSGALREYVIDDPTELFADRAEALIEAAHRNALAIEGRNEYA